MLERFTALWFARLLVILAGLNSSSELMASETLSNADEKSPAECVVYFAR
jgi:hypothetical protein